MPEGFEQLLDTLLPGAGRGNAAAAEAPDFPSALGLEPLGLLGQGGSGWVFRARDPVLDRAVAVKIYRSDGGAQGREAALEEARRAARLAHPAVLPVHRLSVVDGRICVVYALGPAHTLEALIHDPGFLGDRGLAARLVTLRPVASVLARAHAMGMVHGDLHPGNVALGERGETWVLDWAAPLGRGRFSGSAAHAAPERLRGAPASPASDCYALGLLAWEIIAGRSMRPALRGEELGAAIQRWQVDPGTEMPQEISEEPTLSALLKDCLDEDPSRRPTALEFGARLDTFLSGSAARQRRAERGAALLAQARGILARYRTLGRRLDQERQVVAIQSARIPAHASQASKRPLREARARAEALEEERAVLWLEGVQQSTFASVLGEGPSPEAAEILAELWWVRMEDMIARGQDKEARLARTQILLHDPERSGALLLAPGLLSLEVEGAHPARLCLQRVGEPQTAKEHPLPLSRLPLAEGSWIGRVEAEGHAPIPLPLQMSPSEHQELLVRLWSQDQIGEGFVLVSSGPFLLGGERTGREALPRCRPDLADRLVMRAPVTSREWLAFLADLPPREAARRAPAERGLLGVERPLWDSSEGAFQLPEGWDPDWPVVGISAEDAEAYAAWRSAREGRALRLPTEEEWEKAARGVDGRLYPWGEDFDATFTWMRASGPGVQGLAPVGAQAMDRSVYGCVDMAGNVREWTASVFEVGQLVLRGGSWADEAEACRCASRTGLAPEARLATVGFRLVAEDPRA